MFRKTVPYILIWLFAYGLQFTCYASDLSAKAFFATLGTKELERSDIGYSDRERLIESKFRITEESCNPDSQLIGGGSYVKASEENFLYVRSCSEDQGAIFYTYKINPQKSIALFVSISGTHGENQEFSFYSFSADKTISRRSLGDLGITEVRDNELLSSKQKFPSSQNRIVPFVFDTKNGAIKALPWTWMEPRWESKRIIFDIEYIWNGHSFEKKKVKIKQPYKSMKTGG
ncbi:hypothetical protein [Pseudomonas nitroreducens]|uniref:hypothetical protein n=1 Tax=Pseudomonas nitroreducens TaxID=46680 RepID=UPI0011300FF5|nr:hypothetical protein [Pseudomonas nitroreducens]